MLCSNFTNSTFGLIGIIGIIPLQGGVMRQAVWLPHYHLEGLEKGKMSSTYVRALSPLIFMS